MRAETDSPAEGVTIIGITKGGKEHLRLGSEVADPDGTEAPQCGGNSRTVAVVVGAGASAHVIQRCLRMLPSSLSPLWPTIPIDAAVP
jgi:hypothetical protein